MCVCWGVGELWSMCKKAVVALSMTRCHSWVMPSAWGARYHFFYSFPWTCAGLLLLVVSITHQRMSGLVKGEDFPDAKLGWCSFPNTNSWMLGPANEPALEQGCWSRQILSYRVEAITCLGHESFCLCPSNTGTWARCKMMDKTERWCHISGLLTAKDS